MNFFNQYGNKKTEERMYEIACTARDEAVDLTRKDLFGIQQEQQEYRDRNDQNIKYILDKLALLEQQNLAWNKEYVASLNEKENDSYTESASELSCDELCKKLNIKGLDSAHFKFYLYEHGVMEMNINEINNSFKPIANLESCLFELKDYLHIKKWNSITFNPDVIPLLKEREQDILNSILKYDSKRAQYKKSKRELGSKNTENYRSEIVKICGTDGTERWYQIYKVFAKRFPNFWKDFEKYKKENPYVGKYETSKIHYVVSVMGEGNYLLKIACDLYAE